MHESDTDTRQQRTEQLLQLVKAGDADAREKLVEENLGLVWSIVHRFGNRGCEVEDLFQIGSIGLLKAIQRFDMGFGVRFSTYAVPIIMGEVRRFLRDDGVIKISRTVKEQHWKISQTIQQLQERGVGEVTIEMLVTETGLPEDAILLAMDAPVEVESLNRTFAEEEGKGGTLEDRIGVGRDESQQVDDRILLEQGLAQLESKERQLIYLRYFMDYTQTKTAEVLHLSQVQVSRLERKVLNRLRKIL